MELKVGNKLICIKKYISSNDGIEINSVNKKYEIVNIIGFNGNKNDIVVSLKTNTNTTNVFWIKYTYIEDAWDRSRKNNILDNYFITEKELRKLKLFKIEKLNESRRHIIL